MGTSDAREPSVVRGASRAEPETAGQHVCLEDRLEHDLLRSLHNPVRDRRNRQRPALRRSGLGNEHPPRRSERHDPRSVPAATSSSSRDTPYCSTSAMVIRSIPAAPPLRRTSSTPAAAHPCEGSCPTATGTVARDRLGRLVKRVLQGKIRIQTGPLRGGTGQNGTCRAHQRSTTTRGTNFS